MSNPLRLKSIRLVPGKSTKRLDAATAWQDQMVPAGLAAKVDNDATGGRLRLVSIVIVMAVGMIFGFRLYQLQVSAFERYSELANGNRIRETVNFAPRGNIYDREGRWLAVNTVGFRLSVTPYLLNQDGAEREASYGLIADLSGIRLEEIKRLAEADGLDYPLPKSLPNVLEHEVALALQANIDRLQGWSVSELPVRQYRAEAGLAHILGYTGAISPEEYEERAKDELLPIDIVGKAGVEASYDEQLRGQNGFARTEVDTLGRPVRVLAQRESQPGQDIYLSIDLEVQKKLADSLIEQMKSAKVDRASAVALDPNTGEVLAMVSVPWYDNNLFARGISEQDFKRLIEDANEPLTNKVISGGFTTGSTIKPLVAAAALQEKIVTPETIIVDSGAIAVTSVYNPGQAFIFRGWRPGGLGPMNVRSAIAWSSNIYFYTVGGGHGRIQGLGEERLTSYYRQFGLGEVSGIDLPGEIAGRVPDAAWKKDFSGLDWFVGDSYNISIGQGDLLVSPLQLTLANMAIANGGYLLEPQVVYKIGDEVVAERKVRRELKVSKENLQIVREGLRQVMTNGTTSESIFKDVPVKVAGKTGTAQTTSDESRRPHAWFTAYAPFEDPTIMATAMLEEGTGGSQYAAPAIAGAMQAFFSR